MPKTLNFKDLNTEGLSEEHKAKLREATRSFNFFQLKLETGAVSPSEQIRHYETLFLAGATRRDLWHDQWLHAEFSNELHRYIEAGARLRFYLIVGKIVDAKEIELNDETKAFFAVFYEEDAKICNEMYKKLKEMLHKGMLEKGEKE